jgi:hypothetical protein
VKPIKTKVKRTEANGMTQLQKVQSKHRNTSKRDGRNGKKTKQAERRWNNGDSLSSVSYKKEALLE